MGAVGTAADNAMMESFWARLQVEVLNRQRWKTRIELATALHDYLQFHNTRRRHSALGMLTPSEVEAAWSAAENGAVVHATCAKTAPTVLVDESAADGLSDVRSERVAHNHQHLLLTNDQAA